MRLQFLVAANKSNFMCVAQLTQPLRHVLMMQEPPVRVVSNSVSILTPEACSSHSPVGSSSPDPRLAVDPEFSSAAFTYST